MKNDISEKEGLIFDDGKVLDLPQRSHRSKWMIVAVSEGIALTIIIAFIIASNILSQNCSDIHCARQLSPWSPYLEIDELEYMEYTDHEDFWTYSPYQGDPNPDLEKRWDSLWHVGDIGLVEEELFSRLNKTNPELYDHTEADIHKGPLFKGYFSVFHQLHCLHMVRQYIYRDEYDYSHTVWTLDSAENQRRHVNHCIESVRKALMCHSDLTPMLFLNIGEPDLNVQKKCRNFDKIRKWAVENKVAELWEETNPDLIFGKKGKKEKSASLEGTGKESIREEAQEKEEQRNGT